MSPKTLIATLASFVILAASPHTVAALDYAYATAEPQKTGWPLSAEEEAYVLEPEYERRPGAEITQHKPELWPVVPSAGFWGGRSWLDTHAGLVKVAEASKGPIDVLLVGDSITMQWGAAWQKHFGTLKKDLYSSDAIHLTQEGGYELYASRLKPLVENLRGDVSRQGP